MLLQIRELGTQDGTRYYWIRTPRGMAGVVELYAAHVAYRKPARVGISLVGTCYGREYPYQGFYLWGAPTIADLQGGYQTIAAFVACWEYSTPWQRELLVTEDRRRSKWPVHTTEDHPRLVPGKDRGDGWIAVYTKDLRAALKKAKGTIRLGSCTLAASMFRKLISTKGALASPVLEIQDRDGAIALRSKDTRAACTIKHGAGDRFAGRAGFTRRLVFEHA